jgi:hypothetical protein
MTAITPKAVAGARGRRKSLAMQLKAREAECREMAEHITKLEARLSTLEARLASDVSAANEVPADGRIGFRNAPQRSKGTIGRMLADAEERGEMAFVLLDADPDMLDAETFARMLGISVQALHKKRKSGVVLGLTQTTRKVWFPRWQLLPDGRLMDGLSELHTMFGGDAWAVYRFLDQQRHPDLGGQLAREALRAGDKSRVLTVARGVCEHGYS